MLFLRNGSFALLFLTLGLDKCEAQLDASRPKPARTRALWRRDSGLSV